MSGAPVKSTISRISALRVFGLGKHWVSTPAEYAERCLGHVVKGVEGVYNRYEYLEEKRDAFEALPAQVERILNPGAKVVVPLRAAD